MLSRRKAYAGRIKHPDDATEPATLDPLSSIAPLFRARPEIQDVCRFALQWEVVHEAEPAGFAQFHIVTNGNCLLERYSGETFKLEAGSILLLPQGDSHVVRSASRGGSSGAPIRTEYNNAIRIKTNTRGATHPNFISALAARRAAAGSACAGSIVRKICSRYCVCCRRNSPCRWSLWVCAIGPRRAGSCVIETGYY
jgi:AraC family transcriptional regulator, activator of mtrCDE